MIWATQFYTIGGPVAISLIKKVVAVLHFDILPTLDLGRHQNFERLLIVWGHRTVTTEPKYVIFHISKEK